MSSEINPDTVEKTKQQIRTLVSEIAQLSKSDVSAEDYYAAFLQRTVQALAAVGGAIWMLSEGRKLTLNYQINLSESLLDTETEPAMRHFQVLRQVIGNKEPTLVPPLSSGAGEDAGGNPTHYLLVLAPLISEGQVEGVVEIFQRPDAQPATQRGYLRFLVQMCDLASEWLNARKLKKFSDRHSLWAQADHFSRLVHDSLDLRETCYTLTNEGRRLIGCDRVSVAIKRGARCRVEAVSGQDTIELRSNIVRYLSDLASKVVATGEPLWYDGSTEDLPPQIENSVNDYVEESYSKTIVVLPLRKPKTGAMRTDEHVRNETQLENNEANEVVGAMVVEQIETDLPREILEPRIDLVYEHSARAISNALDHHNLFLMPVWKSLGKLSVVTKARNLPTTLGVAAVVLAVLAALFFIPADFALKADGSLQPLEMHKVFVRVPGRVVSVDTSDWAPVATGDKLLELENFEFQQELDELDGRIEDSKTRIANLNHERTNDELDYSRKMAVNHQINQERTNLKSLERQRAHVEDKLRHLTIESPIDGHVMLAWDVQKSLMQRTLQPGQELMAVADPTKEWELELYVPERRMGHIMKAYRDSKLGPELTVKYILATEPGTTYTGKVKYIDRVTRMHEEHGHVQLIRVDISENHDKHKDPRPNATVTAKVVCGRCSLGYSWFHEAFEWLQSHILF